MWAPCEQMRAHCTLAASSGPKTLSPGPSGALIFGPPSGLMNQNPHFLRGPGFCVFKVALLHQWSALV